jgi:methyl-accepting chemotaxis protein
MILDGLIPKKDALSDDELRKKRLFVIASFVVSFFGLFFAEEIWRTDGGTEGVVLLLGGAIFGFTNATVLQKSPLEPWGPHLLVVLMQVVMWGLPYTSGNWLWDASVWWQIPIPLVAGFLLGTRAAALTAGVLAFGMFAYFMWAPSDYVPAGDALFFRFLAAVTVIITVLLLTIAYESSRRAALSQVDEALAGLKKANVELERLAQENNAARKAAEEASEKKGSLLQSMREAIEAQGIALDQTSSSMAEITTTLRVVTETVGSVEAASAQSNQSAADVREKSVRMEDRIVKLATAIADTAAALEQIGMSVQEVSRNVESLNQVAEQTAVAMNQMQASIEEVSKNADQTQRLSDHVIRDAGIGEEAVKHTREGIEQVVQISQIGTRSIRALAERVGAIGQLLDVIRDVADQTQLLSLNAAIIAEQAGEKGRGFGVVAAEIKKLADRTSHSAKDIAVVIQRIQKEAKHAVMTIASSESAADEGMARVEEALDKLKVIVNSATETTNMIGAIANATTEQQRSAADVVGAMERLAGNTAQIAGATVEQARTAERLIRNTSEMQTFAQDLESAGREQKEEAQAIEDVANQIHAMIQHLHQAQTDQARGSEQVLSAIERIADQQSAQVESMNILEVMGDLGERQ